MPGPYNIVTADGKLLYTSVWLSLSPLNSSWSALSREDCLSPCLGMLHVASWKFQAHVYILLVLIMLFKGVGVHRA